MREELIRLAVFVAVGVTACGGNATGIEGDEAALGAPARVVVEEVRWAGGQGTRISTTFDSATARYTVARCQEAPGGPTCAETTQSSSGAMLLESRDRMFAQAQSAEFRALRAAYRAPAGVTPPDYEAGSLTVTANERVRTISWERGATIPPTLASYLCLLAVARGELISCAG